LKKEKQLFEVESAIQQFIGFVHGKKGFSLIELISSMGLKKTEWKTIKKDKLNLFDDFDIKQVDEYSLY